jgi:hypothetical protein
MAKAARRADTGEGMVATRLATRSARWARYQRPTRNRITIATMAATENQARLRCPHGTTMKAASSGPRADPPFPPT